MGPGISKEGLNRPMSGGFSLHLPTMVPGPVVDSHNTQNPAQRSISEIAMFQQLAIG
jgi:hypothetical protein